MDEKFDVNKELETERREYNELLSLLVNIQKDYTWSNKMKDWIIIVLVVCMCLEACIGFVAFAWYESQFETVDTYETTVDLDAEGENANAEYNDIEGNLYKDNSIHNENRKESE